MSLEADRRPIKVIGTPLFYDRGRYTSATGRLLGEYSSGEPYISRVKAAGVDMSLKQCDYPGFRNGYNINEGARRELTSNWQGVLDGLGWIRQVIFQGRNIKPVTAAQSLLLAEAGYCLPDFLFNRKVDAYAPNGALPDVIADIPKVSAGFRTVAGILYEQNPQLIVTPESLHDFAETNRLLLSEDRQRVCAESRPVILKAGKALLYGNDTDPQSSILQTTILNSDQFYTFARSYSDLQTLLRKMNQLTAAALGVLAQSPPFLQMQLLQLYSQDENKFLQDANSIQVKMNQALGYDPSEISVLTLKDVESELEVTPSAFLKKLEARQGNRQMHKKR